MAVVLAIIITVAIRLTFFGDDCNLFVVGMTFLFVLFAIGVIFLLAYRLK